MPWIRAYKGFDRKLQCQPDKNKPPFEYAIGKEYEEDSAELCVHGFHACENPMDVFWHYPPADSRYCEVELDATDELEEDSKRCGKKIRLVSEIGIDGIIKAGVKVIFDKVDFVNSLATNTGDWSAATNTGDWSAATVSGKESVACSTGYGGKAKGAVGCWLVLAEWERGHRIDVQCFHVDGQKIKADTWYMLKKGKPVEVE